VTCESCQDKGLIRLNWADHEEEFALCLCPAGMKWRKSSNGDTPTNPAWHVWCARHQIPHERVVRMEDVLTDDELHARGFGLPTLSLDREARLRAAGRAKEKHR
jgi:hypothetical protein